MAREASINRNSRGSGNSAGWPERLVTAGTVVVEATERLLTTRAAVLDGKRG